MINDILVFCNNNKQQSNKMKMIIDTTNNGKSYQDIFNCNEIEFQITPDDTLNIILENGKEVKSYVFQNCNLLMHVGIIEINHRYQPYKVQIRFQ